jgi:hypothetical protein
MYLKWDSEKSPQKCIRETVLQMGDIDVITEFERFTTGFCDIPVESSAEFLDLLHNFNSFLLRIDHPNALDTKAILDALQTEMEVRRALHWFYVAHAYWMVYPGQEMLRFQQR